MLLAIDIGNSNITLGGIQEGEILFEARLATDATKTSDEYGVEIKDMLDLFGARVEEIRDCIVASVVPPVFNSVRNGIVKLTGKEPMVVGPGIKTGINILLEDPGATGADLIAAAVAAVDAYPTPLTVVDMGTATTIAVIDDGNAFLGGAVLPGLRISAEALSSRASLLPGIQLERPRRAIGKNTVECMQSGLMFGAAAMSLSCFCVVSNALRLDFFKMQNASKDKKIQRVDISDVTASLKTDAEAENSGNSGSEPTMMKTLEIEGMMCGHCEKMVKRCLEKFPQISEAVVSYEAGTAVISMNEDVPEDDIKQAIEKAGYEYIGTKSLE